ncbi:MAG: response regulator [Nitrospirae bacterium]|nr:response regulator [Nitrospirota bacterium]MBF0536173.1 response regulator [Nitrospirota bacterium]MBF0618202.1 response regulator [Nitrospirota bacterium]
MSDVKDDLVLKLYNGPSILIVEDEEIVALELENKLKKLGYTVLQKVPSAEEAKKAAEELMPDIVLMDITLSGELDGTSAAQYIFKTYNIPVVYMTAHTDIETMHRAKLTEPFGYIVKPYSQRDLIISIALALYRHKVETKLRIIIAIQKIWFKSMPVKDKLEQSLRKILATPRLTFVTNRGIIYLFDDTKKILIRTASVGSFGCEHVPVGKCLCGLAASTQETVFASKIDDRHEFMPDNIPHGHYCIPIKTANQLFGVLNVYLHEGVKIDPADEKILTDYTDVIAYIMEESH